MKDYEIICIKYKGTIYPMTDNEWDEIGERYQCYSAMYCGTSDWMLLSEYLKDLIDLKSAEEKK